MNESKDLIKRFRWKTMKGEILTLAEMDTKHCFNSMKMMWNHLIYQHKGTATWFTKQYNGAFILAKREPEKVLKVVLIFLTEIHRRNDLPEKYIKPYQEIIRNIAKVLGLEEIEIVSLKMIEWIKEEKTADDYDFESRGDEHEKLNV